MNSTESHDADTTIKDTFSLFLMNLPNVHSPKKLINEVEKSYPDLEQRIRVLKHRFDDEFMYYSSGAKTILDLSKKLIQSIDLKHETSKGEIKSIDLDEIDFYRTQPHESKEVIEIIFLDKSTHTLVLKDIPELAFETFNVAKTAYLYLQNIDQQQKTIEYYTNQWSVALGTDNENSQSTSSLLNTTDPNSILVGVNKVFNAFKGKLPEIKSADELYIVKKLKYDGTLGELGIFLKALEKHGFSIKKMRNLKYQYFFHKRYKVATYVSAKKEAARGAKLVSQNLKDLAK